MTQKFLCGLGMLGLLFLAQPVAADRSPDEHFFGQFLGDFREELQTARDQGKTGVLVFFEMDECPFCHRMKTTVLNQEEVQDYYQEHFLIYAVDVEGDVEIVDFDGETKAEKDFAFRDHRVRATPVFGFFDLNGKMVVRYTGATRDASEFLLLGRYVVEQVYKEMSFSRYKRQQKPGGET